MTLRSGTVVDFHGQLDRPAGAPRALFTTALSGSGSRGYGRKYAVTPDGQRILAIVPTATETPHPATVMLNWRAGIGRQP